MKKSTIITIIAVIIAIAILAIIGVLIFGNKDINESNKNNDTEIIKVDTTSKDVQPDSFKATIINKDNNQITVVANEDAAIAQVNNSRVIVVLYNESTKILKEGQQVDVSDIPDDQEITINYDGNIIIAQPITIRADEIIF